MLVELRNPARRFLVHSRLDLWVLKEVCLDRQYERVGEPIEDGWVIVDVGAGIGEFAVDVALRCPASRVHAFEPSPSAYALLSENVRHNGVRNVQTYPLAVGAYDGKARLDTSSPLTVLHRLADHGGEGGGPGLEVACRRLDTLFDELQIERCDFLKIDCEGGEYDLLEGVNEATLSRIRRICLEHHPRLTRSHESLVELLGEAGFTTRLTPGPAFQQAGFLYAWRD